MDLSVSIGGVAMTGDAHFVDEGSPSHVNAIGQRDTFSCRVVSKDGSYRPAIGAAVEVSDDVGLRFGGSIRELNLSQFGAGLIAEIQCASWEAILDRRLVGQSQYNNNAGDIFTRLCIDYLEIEGVTGSVVVTGPQIHVTFDWCTLREAFDKICELASDSTDVYMWDVTPAKVARFYKQSSFPAPFNVTDSSSEVLRPITLNQSFGSSSGSGVGYANKVRVRVGRFITDPRDNTFHPLEALDTLSFELPIAKAPTVTINGVAKTVGIRDVDSGKDCYWQDGSPDVTFATEPAIGSTVVITAQGYQSTVVDAGQDDDEVAARSVAEDNSGWYEVLVELSDGKTSADAYAAGLATLADKGRIPNAIEYPTTTNGVKAGQYQTINLPFFGVNATFVIESVRLFQAGPYYGWMVRAVNGSLASGWLQKLRAIASGSTVGTGGTGGTVVTPGATTTPPGNPTIASVEADAQPTTGSATRGTRNSTAKRGITIKYTAPDPVGTFLGVFVQVEAPDQSATDTRPLDDSVPLDGSRSLGGPKDPISFGPFAHADVAGSLRVQIPEPDAALLPMGCRARLIPYSDTVTNDAATAPTATFTIADPTASKPDSGTAYAPNPQSITIPATVPGSGVRGAAQANPYRVTVSGVDETHLWVTVTVDARAAGYVLQVFSPSGELINATGIETAKHFELVFNTPAAVGDYRVYALGSDGTNINPLVDGITPYATVSLGTTGGTVNLAQATPASMGLGLGSDGESLNVKIAGPIYEDVAGNINLKISPHFVVGVDGALTQDIVDLALATGFDTSAFSGGGGSNLTIKSTWITAQAIACNQLVAGNALFAGDATFARSGGGKLTLNSAGLTIADHNTSPNATVTLASTGATIAKGANNVQVTALGVAINGPSGTLTATSSGVVIANGTSSVTVSATAVTIVNGALSSPTITGGSLTGTSLLISSGGVTITVNSTDYVKVDAGSGSTTAKHHYSYFRVDQASDANRWSQVAIGAITCSTGAGTSALLPGALYVNGNQVMGPRIGTRPVTLADVINAGVTHGWWA